MRCLLLILLFIFFSSPVGAVAPAETAYGKARDAYYRLIESSQKKLYRDNWGKVIDLFTVVHKRYPDSSRGADAAFMVGSSREQLYAISRLRGDAERAVESYDEMATAYPQSNLADDALMTAGKLLEQPLLIPSEAFLRYQRIVDELPRSDMAAEARRAVTRLKHFAPQLMDAREKSNKSTGKATLEAIRFWSNPGYTRVVLDLSTTVKYRTNFLKGNLTQGAPPRLYIDFEDSTLGAEIVDATTVDDGLLRRIRTGKPKDGCVRVVIDLDSFQDYKVFALEEPYRIVVDVQGNDTVRTTIKEPSKEDPEQAGKTSPDDSIAVLLNEHGRSAVPRTEITKKPPALAGAEPVLKRVVIDAGHGGKDPGAVGPNRVFEKNVVLDFAKKLGKRLEDEIGCEVILTRDRDVYLRLEERTAIANQVNADLFISIHANANQNRKVHGVETYYLNFSKNDKAAAVAARENGTSLKQVGDLELILFDLMANAKLNESSRLANDIQSSLVSKLTRHYSPLRDLGVRQGPFYVLLGATMPSVLVEVAFISNHRGEKRLTDQVYQNHAISGIVSGIRKYAGSYKVIAAK
ncbi:MAG: N-acetylmuramoyl-L-alanine amidase [Desulfuromonadales bacterium]|nr:N-acetylmuramoyl-L-alanine amidase [Desulfuromonadales bacterium]